MQTFISDPAVLVNGFITLGAVIGGIKISMNGIHKSLSRLEEGQTEVKGTLVDHGERLVRVETQMESLPKE